ncbi:cyclic AMP-dependent transcription factor ATF-6 alpha isoform X2 [Bufo gargarizans]|uniref:cyclic AMP-dependent transcription factor ATF-6 alpha isoform X2 n=1 Tax=Bufo gargarizans TaxID=30331 RepID=UPI001CF26D4A|nr:cyclic AMP-dependent transcription factor ATF-6 alpha isoform X2 [Bufo gargarizans]
MTSEVEHTMFNGVQGPGPGGGGISSLDGLEWDSSLFEELSNLVDVDFFEDGNCGACETSYDDLDFTVDLMSWSSYPWDVPDNQCTDLKSEPLSPASSSCSVQSPLPANSPLSSSQYVPEDNFSGTRMSPLSLYSEATIHPISPDQAEEKPAITIPLSMGNSSTKLRKLAPVLPKPSIQPKIILVPNSTDIHSAAGIAPKPVLLQPLTTLLPKPQPLITIQPTKQAGQVILTPSAVVQLSGTGVVTSQPVLTVSGAPSINLLSHTKTSPVKKLSQTSIQTTDCGTDINVIRRQQRMIKNRESAFQSRRKKKEYMQCLEIRLRAALSENERLKNENGSLQKLLEEVVSENQKLKITAPKRRAVCLMMLAAFLMINFNPLSILEYNPGPFDVEVSLPRPRSRNLLAFSPDSMNIKDKEISPPNTRHENHISTEKALMIVKEDPLLYIPPPPPCRPHVNQTESLRLNQELRGWVHRHEVERTKSRRTLSTHKARAVQKSDEKDGIQLVTVQYTETSLKNSVNELQIYYSSPRSYQEFLEAIRRRSDTFYIVSFRRDHLLLPATSRNKTSRPKISIILPSTNVDDNVINEQEYEVMMQIDCEVMDTRILHVKSETIPPFLREHRENRTNSFYNAASSGHVVSTISESPL